MTNQNKDHIPLNQSKDIQRYDIENDIRLKRDAISDKEVTADMKVRRNNSDLQRVIKQQNTLESSYDVIFLNSDQQPIYLVPLANVNKNDSNGSENDFQPYLKYIQDSESPLVYPFNSSNEIQLKTKDPQQLLELNCNNRRTDDTYCSFYSATNNLTEGSKFLKQPNAKNHTNFIHSDIDPILSVKTKMSHNNTKISEQTENEQAPKQNVQNRTKCDCLDKKEHNKSCDLYEAKLIFDLRGAPAQLNLSSLIKETLRQLNYLGGVKIMKDCPDRLKKMEKEMSDARTQRDLIEAYDSLIKKFELIKSLTH